MHKHLTSLVCGFLAVVASLALTGCGGDSSVAATGPSSSGFSGSTISINPVITFVDGTNLTYTNTETSSPFPAALTPVNGTYTYAPSADFTSGTLTLTLDAPISDSLSLTINSFAQSGGNVTGFRAAYNGRTFSVSVTGGTILAQVVNTRGGGSTPGANETAATAIPVTMQGTYDLVFHEYAAGSNIADGTATQFVISANTLVFGGKTLSNPVFRAGNNLEWIFKDGSLEYAASIAVNNSLNEINVGAAAGAAFYGQYNDRPLIPVIEVDSDGKFVPYTNLNFSIDSEDNSVVGLTFADMPALTDPVSFTVNDSHEIEIAIGGNGSYRIYKVAYASADTNSVTYNSVTMGGSTTKTYNIVVQKDANNQPTTATASFTHQIGGRISINSYTLSATTPAR